MSRRPHPQQGAFICEGMTPDTVGEADMSAVFALWVERVADYDRAAAEIIAGRLAI